MPYRARAFAALMTLCLAVPAFAQVAYQLYEEDTTAPRRLDVPYVPTPVDVVDRMLHMANVQPHDYLIDLGSGDGRIVIAAVRDFDVGTAIGIDLDPDRVAEARQYATEAGVADRVRFDHGDLFERDLSNATVLTMYLLPEVNQQLRPVILETMAPGTRIVSHAFGMGDWQPDQQDDVSGSFVYLWIVPARINGEWQLQKPDGEVLKLSLTQRYQEFEGTATGAGSATRLKDTALHGDEVRFAIDNVTYTGKVLGDMIIPTSDAAGWHARRL